MLSENITKGIIFTTGEALTILENRYSKPTLIKHLKNTGKFLYENMGRGKYEML
jgi:hypothetical protein